MLTSVIHSTEYYTIPPIPFPKTPRLLQEPPKEWRSLTVIVEEKLDGANAGVSFDASGKLVLQSRGHILTGHPRESQFDLLKTWAATHEHDLRARVKPHQVVFGEWLYAKHRVFYDKLPAYFIAYDVYDQTSGMFLPQKLRQEILDGLTPCPPVLHRGPFGKVNSFAKFIGRSAFRSPKWRDTFKLECERLGLAPAALMSETDDSELMEGVYVRIESETEVVGRMKLPRPEFEKVRVDDEKWGRRAILPNVVAQ